jgi:hypothetical protein
MDKLVMENGIGNLFERSTQIHMVNDQKVEFTQLFEAEDLVLPYQSIRHGILYRTYQIGSVIGGAVKDGNDPLEALERAKSFGHQLVFIFGLGSSIHNGPRSTRKHIFVKHGMTVRFMGQFYEIIKTSNDNLGLKPITF